MLYFEVARVSWDAFIAPFVCLLGSARIGGDFSFVGEELLRVVEDS